MKYKSGVDFEGGREVSEKETATAMIESLKDESGLFDSTTSNGREKAPNHNFKVVKNGLSKALTGLDRVITAYKADINGIPHFTLFRALQMRQREIRS